MRSLLASPLGFLVGLSLGALGGGGSILAVPALVYGVGESAQAATSTSLIVVGFASLVGIIPHWRRGHVRFGAGVVFGAAGIGGSVVGTALNRGVDPDALLVAFSGFMVLAGVAMLRRARATAPLTEASPELLAVASTESSANSATEAPAELPARPSTELPARPSTEPSTELPPDGTDDTPAIHRAGARLDARAIVKVIVAGTVVGALTGFFGVGGGFVIVPALVIALGLSMPEAVGTSLVVIAINAAIALVLRVGESTIDWGAATPFLITAVIGTIVGGRIAERVDPRRLTYAFVVLLAVIAAYTGISAVIALTAG